MRNIYANPFELIIASEPLPAFIAEIQSETHPSATAFGALADFVHYDVGLSTVAA